MHTVVVEIRRRDLFRIRRCLLSDATSAHEYLGLQQLISLPRLALHVVDRIANFDVCVESEDHAPGFLKKLRTSSKQRFSYVFHTANRAGNLTLLSAKFTVERLPLHEWRDYTAAHNMES